MWKLILIKNYIIVLYNVNFLTLIIVLWLRKRKPLFLQNTHKYLRIKEYQTVLGKNTFVCATSYNKRTIIRYFHSLTEKLEESLETQINSPNKAMTAVNGSPKPFGIKLQSPNLSCNSLYKSGFCSVPYTASSFSPEEFCLLCTDCDRAAPVTETCSTARPHVPRKRSRPSSHSPPHQPTAIACRALTPPGFFPLSFLTCSLIASPH